MTLMTRFFGRRLTVTLAALLLTGCGGKDSTAPSEVQILNVSVNLDAGVNCDQGGAAAEFAGQAGKTYTILASGASSLRPFFVLYAPDFGTQLGASSAYGNGKARLSIGVTETGTFHLTVCEVNGAGGTLKITVVAPNL